MVEIKYTGDALWERIERAVEKVKDRLRRVARALNAANKSAAMPFSIGYLKSMNRWYAILAMSISS